MNKLTDSRIAYCIKQTTRSLIKQKIKPTIQMIHSKMLYTCNIDNEDHTLNISDQVENFYDEFISCLESYPNELIYLVGYSSNVGYPDHISHMYLLHNPNGKTVFDEEAQSYL